ncbi:hypothetical protein B0H12DRAFT_1244606 [Mycena haematopus]|nr:hypothetical protein B0H12DRAFT_1244606 [Mycena haematopus]
MISQWQPERVGDAGANDNLQPELLSQKSPSSAERPTAPPIDRFARAHNAPAPADRSQPNCLTNRPSSAERPYVASLDPKTALTEIAEDLTSPPLDRLSPAPITHRRRRRRRRSPAKTALTEIAPAALKDLTSPPLDPPLPTMTPFNHSSLVLIKGFVHEVLRRSRTSGSVLQTALCYPEVIRPKVPELIRNLKEQSGEGAQSKYDSESRHGAHNEEDVIDTVCIYDNEDLASTATPFIGEVVKVQTAATVCPLYPASATEERVNEG